MVIDKINKLNKVIVGKFIFEKVVYNYYIFFILLGVLLGFIVFNSIEKLSLIVVFILVVVLFYWYVIFIKLMFFIGNLFIFLLVGFSLLIVIFFDIFLVLNEMDKFF